MSTEKKNALLIRKNQKEKIRDLENKLHNIDDYHLNFTKNIYPSLINKLAKELFEDFNFKLGKQDSIRAKYNIRFYAEKEKTKGVYLYR